MCQYLLPVQIGIGEKCIVMLAIPSHSSHYLHCFDACGFVTFKSYMHDVRLMILVRKSSDVLSAYDLLREDMKMHSTSSILTQKFTKLVFGTLKLI